MGRTTRSHGSPTGATKLKTPMKKKAAKTLKVGKAKTEQKTTKKQTDLSSQEETAYERLLKKVNQKRASDQTNSGAGQAKRIKQQQAVAANVDDQSIEMVQFQEEGNFMEMAVSKSVQRKEFPSPSDGEEESASETEEGEVIDESQNNNATIEQSGEQPLLGVVGSQGSTATSARS